MLTGKTLLLGVTGSIAAYKAAALASALKKQGCDVHVIMTKNAANFINPITFEELTGNRCLTDSFDRNFQFQVTHVALAKRADLCIIAPASANVLAKLAHGLADDLLTTTVLACTCPKLLAPAMNTRMYENPITQANLQALRQYGFRVITPASGYLACGDNGAGKLPEPETLLEHVLQELAFPKDMAGLRVLVTAGPTQEALDPVRFLTNHSTGKMGYALARCAAQRGASVTLVTGPTALPPPPFMEIIPITSAAQMFEAVTSRAAEQDIILKAAAVADYTPAAPSAQKLKKSGDGLALPLARTQDILSCLGERCGPGQFLCGFAMETENLLENARKKLAAKHLDMVAANSLFVEGAGFAGDSNVLTLITATEELPLPKMSKDAAAARILDVIMEQRAHQARD